VTSLLHQVTSLLHQLTSLLHLVTSVLLVTSITLNMCSCGPNLSQLLPVVQAQEGSELRGSSEVAVEDVLFVLRHDHIKLQRLLQYLGAPPAVVT
jgi:hypothetical protein